MKLIVVGKLQEVDHYKSSLYGDGQFSQILSDTSVYLIKPDETLAKIASPQKIQYMLLCLGLRDH